MGLESKAKTKDNRQHSVRHYKPEDKARWNKKYNDSHLDERHEYYLKNKESTRGGNCLSNTFCHHLPPVGKVGNKE